MLVYEWTEERIYLTTTSERGKQTIHSLYCDWKWANAVIPALEESVFYYLDDIVILSKALNNASLKASFQWTVTQKVQVGKDREALASVWRDEEQLGQILVLASPDFKSTLVLQTDYFKSEIINKDRDASSTPPPKNELIV
jgi:hypothetical protein